MMKCLHKKSSLKISWCRNLVKRASTVFLFQAMLLVGWSQTPSTNQTSASSTNQNSAGESRSSTNRSSSAGASVKYVLGADSLPQEGVPKGRLEGPHLFRSKIFTNTVRKYWVYVPAQYDPEKAACVLVFQDGQRATRTNGSLRIPQVMENLIHKREMPVTIGIFITPGAKGEEYVEVGGGNPNNRSFEYDSLSDLYSRFLIEEMLPEVGKQYNLTKDPEGRAIGGTSSGAICAFTVAWHRPDQFRKVLSCIGSFTDIRGGHVYPQLIRESEKKPIRLFLEETFNDNRNERNPKRDWFLQNQAMIAALKEKNYDFTYVFHEGTHSDSPGGTLIPEMLRFLWRDYPK
jgi:enterochelin esterase family protein